MSESNLPAKIETFDLDDAALVKLKTHLDEDKVKENMDSVDRARLPELKLASGGAKGFVLPSGDALTDFRGVILQDWNTNAFWLKSMDESDGNAIPDCFSLDGKVPEERVEHQQSETCKKCIQNMFLKDGSGKPCKNMKRILMVFEDRNLPYILRVPPTSLRTVNDYMLDLTDIGISKDSVVTHFSTEIKESRLGQKFASLIMTKVGLSVDPMNPAPGIEKFESLKRTYEEIAKRTVIEDEPEGTGSAGTTGSKPMEPVTESPPEEGFGEFDTDGPVDDDGVAII